MNKIKFYIYSTWANHCWGKYQKTHLELWRERYNRAMTRRHLANLRIMVGS